MKTPYVCQHIWKNGMGVATRVFQRRRNDEPSDLIELTIKPGEGRGKPGKWLLNVEDANAIIHCLSTAIAHVIEQGSPVRSSGEEFALARILGGTR